MVNIVCTNVYAILEFIVTLSLEDVSARRDGSHQTVQKVGDRI